MTTSKRHSSLPSDERILEYVQAAHKVLNDELPAGHKLWKSWAYDLADNVLALARQRDELVREIDMTDAPSTQKVRDAFMAADRWLVTDPPERLVEEHRLDMRTIREGREALQTLVEQVEALEHQIEMERAAHASVLEWDGATTERERLQEQLERLEVENLRLAGDIPAIPQPIYDPSEKERADRLQEQFDALREATREYVRVVNEHAEALADYAEDMDADAEQIVSSLGFIGQLDKGCLDADEDSDDGSLAQALDVLRATYPASREGE